MCIGSFLTQQPHSTAFCQHLHWLAIDRSVIAMSRIEVIIPSSSSFSFTLIFYAVGSVLICQDAEAAQIFYVLDGLVKTHAEDL